MNQERATGKEQESLSDAKAFRFSHVARRQRQANGSSRDFLRSWKEKAQASDAPATFALEQNYPNPFNPSTRIKYTIEGIGDQGSGIKKTRLVVYDLLGRQVAVLVDERKAPGNYEVTFDASGLSSGVYFYRMEAGMFAQTRKLVLVR